MNEAAFLKRHHASKANIAKDAIHEIGGAVTLSGPSLRQLVEHLAFLIDRAPQSELLPGDDRDHLLKVPPRSRARAASKFRAANRKMALVGTTGHQ